CATSDAMRERRTLTSAYSAATKKPFASTSRNTSASFTSTDVSEDSIYRIIIAGCPVCRKQRFASLAYACAKPSAATAITLQSFQTFDERRMFNQLLLLHPPGCEQVPQHPRVILLQAIL